MYSNNVKVSVAKSIRINLAPGGGEGRFVPTAQGVTVSSRTFRINYRRGMVIVKLIGGLGNQLFQYAAGFRLAWRNHVPLKLDLSAFNSYTRRAYSLSQFNISAAIATPDEIVSAYDKGNFIKEAGVSFDARILNCYGNIYLDGYWQSEKYFADISNIIRQEFTIKYEPDEKNKELANYINNCQSVAIHIRRGDYATDAQMNAVHGTLELQYYHRCISKLLERITDPHFFIFSDDPDWVRDNFHLDYPVTIISHNGPQKNYEDLRLMSLCHHNIIANSTFSWWGAWLNLHPDKIVFAPVQWFNDQQIDTSDLIPESWHRL